MGTHVVSVTGDPAKTGETAFLVAAEVVVHVVDAL